MYNLSDIHGRKILTGIDNVGIKWQQFELDYHRNEQLKVCKDCNKELEYGWVQVNDSEVTVCDSEMEYVTKRSYYFPDDIPLHANVNPLKTQPDNTYWLLN